MYRFMTYFRGFCFGIPDRRCQHFHWHSKGEWDAWQRALRAPSPNAVPQERR